MRDQSSSTGLLERPATSPQTQPAEGITVPALTYTQVRLLAECAAGTDNTAAHFVFAGTALTRTRSNVAPATAVLVPARHNGRYSRLYQIGLQRAAPLELAGEQLEGVALNAVDYSADAIFWSDSAVRKFLIPYVASCGASDAASVLQRLQQAWNGYPGTVPVYALMHVTPYQFDTPLTLGNALWVVFADEDGMLGAQPLDEFLPETSLADGGRSFAVGGAEAVDVPYGRGSMEVPPQYPDYVTLRAMAEYAASLSSQPYYFVFRAGNDTFDEPISAELPTDLQRGDFVIPVQTPTVPRDRPELGAVWFQPQEQDKAMDISLSGDAMFWSTGAIEQFMFPYYASKLGFAAPEDLSAVRQAWNPAYVPPSADALGEGQEYELEEAARETSLTGDTEVYALVHLPRSDWVSGDQAEAEAEALARLSGDERDALQRARATRNISRFSAQAEVGVVHRARSGEVNVLPLADFKAIFPQHFA